MQGDLAGIDALLEHDNVAIVNVLSAGVERGEVGLFLALLVGSQRGSEDAEWDEEDSGKDGTHGGGEWW